ncbi:PGAP1-like alpha/beta domain-containing protein [Pseudomonas sp. CCOS 191]|uniref:PGAP1-like alpha/beta domain-containing protein n=1 Tax=Pseudomonas sp. CCOS 191 TaxID=1649877 RepID=UPI000624776D|nr:hypothetical protein [Pseudomonas sp. CCOS 191]CRI57075.1 PGAP1-like protein [Pseudomonas sp. CCOS 191]
MRDYAVVFVHGLAKKPSPDKLKEIWLWGLERTDTPPPFDGNNPGIDLVTQGVPPFFNYYADVFYGTDYETDFGAYYEALQDTVVEAEHFEEVAGVMVPPKPSSEEEVVFLREIQRKMNQVPSPPGPSGTQVLSGAREPGQLEIASWLPGPVKEAVIKRAAMEAYYFLFRKDYVRPSDGLKVNVRDELCNGLIKDLIKAQKEAKKIVLVTHSMGTMIAYDVLRNFTHRPPVEVLFTLGSPLGITEVQEQLRPDDQEHVDFPPQLGRWINIYDPLDPVCGADPKLDDFLEVDGRKVENLRESNWGSWRHTITHYFAGRLLRQQLAQAVGLRR